ncbi:MAG: hypothetical protein ACXAAO_10510 [Candidatus Thorarchaeota archaeon]
MNKSEWVIVSEISKLVRLSKYLQHGFALGVIVIVPSVFLAFFFGSWFFLLWLLGLPLMYAAYFAIVFALLGGVNQVLSTYFWGIEVEQSIGNGMRDGFLLYIIFNIAYLPVTLAVNALAMWGFWFAIPSYVQATMLVIVSAPIYFVLLGFIGEKTTIFLYVDTERELPSDFSDNSFSCIHCGSRYYYKPGVVRDGVVTCQNCAQDFRINQQHED